MGWGGSASKRQRVVLKRDDLSPEWFSLAVQLYQVHKTEMCQEERGEALITDRKKRVFGVNCSVLSFSSQGFTFLSILDTFLCFLLCSHFCESYI